MQSLNFSFRYEYFNKGADLFVESLARLNHLLKVMHLTVIDMFWHFGYFDQPHF